MLGHSAEPRGRVTREEECRSGGGIERKKPNGEDANGLDVPYVYYIDTGIERVQSSNDASGLLALGQTP